MNKTMMREREQIARERLLHRRSWISVFALFLVCLVAVAQIEINRAGALSDLSTQVEIAAGQSEVNALRAKLFKWQLEQREERCFHWGGKP